MPGRQGETMTCDTLQHIPLATAYLCQDCNCVGNSSTCCPACSSRVLLCLAGVLDRKVEVAGARLLLFPTLAA